jgi:uncharacterized membrane protein YfcA
MTIPIDIVLIVFFVALLQSIFGVGVLLVGTPLLMLAGYSYFYVLSLTLPTSLVISISQVLKYYKHINIPLFKKAFPIVIIMIIIGMFLAKFLGGYVGIFIGFFLFFTSFEYTANAILPANSSEKRVSIVIFLMCLIQGTTSLGGAILPSVVSQKCKTKEQKLATTSAIYVLFQLTQIAYILFYNHHFNFSKTGICVIVGFVTYSLIGKNLFQAIKSDGYIKYLRVFIRVVALLLVTLKIYNLI